MKVAIVLATLLGLTSAGTAAAQEQVSDAAFLKANRCRGLALGLGADATPFKAYLKNQDRSRADLILFRGNSEAGQAKREAADPANKDRLTAELGGPCSAFVAPAQSAAGGGAPHQAHGATQ